MARKRGRPRKGEIITKEPPPAHWLRVASLYSNTTLCGQMIDHIKVVSKWEDVTCRQCKRLGEAHPEYRALKPMPSNPLAKRITDATLDAMISRAFQGTEASLAQLVTNAQRALDDWERTKVHRTPDPVPENMADVIRGFINILRGPQ